MDTEELVTAEALRIATRAGVYGCLPLVVALVLGLDPAWGTLTVPPIAWISGLGWAGFGISVAGFAKSFENFNSVVSTVLTPLFLVAGTFFPLDQLPEWLQVLANLNPLYHLRRASPPAPRSARRARATSPAWRHSCLRLRHVADSRSTP